MIIIIIYYLKIFNATQKATINIKEVTNVNGNHKPTQHDHNILTQHPWTGISRTGQSKPNLIKFRKEIEVKVGRRK